MTGVDNTIRVLIMAGGTGGHVFPALAVADELKSRGVEITWLGTKNGIEADVVPRAGYKIAYISVTGLRGKGFLGWLIAPVKLLYALSQCISVMRSIKPAAVLGMGGFVTGPGGLAAWLFRKPLLVHEQNAIAGLTNRLLTPLAKVVMEAFPKALATPRAIHVGNPVRANIGGAQNEELKTEKKQRDQAGICRQLLVVGGSLGATALNEVVPQALSLLESDMRPEIWHQTGKRHIDQAQAHYKKMTISARVEPFIDDMAAAYQWADLVLCRAGALTVSELAIAGVASILVPYPYAVDDHQTANAKYLVDAGAAVLIQQSKLTAEKLAELLRELDAEKVKDMGSLAKKIAMPKATKMVADQCMELASG